MIMKIIENTPEAIEEFHNRGWGGEELDITPEQLQALLGGKCLAFFDGEYTHVIRLAK